MCAFGVDICVSVCWCVVNVVLTEWNWNPDYDEAKQHLNRGVSEHKKVRVRVSVRMLVRMGADTSESRAANSSACEARMASVSA